MLKRNLCKFLLGSVGKILPLRRHPGGKIGNIIRCSITKGIIKNMGKYCIIEKGAEVMEDCIFGDGTSIGPHCMIGPGTIFKGYNMMGPNVHIYTTGHRYSAECHRFEGMNPQKPVTIEEYVWIGYGVIILPGVTIGNHTIIGAGSVVTKDIPSGVVAAGNPCEVKKILDKKYYVEESVLIDVK